MVFPSALATRTCIGRSYPGSQQPTQQSNGSLLETPAYERYEGGTVQPSGSPGMWLGNSISSVKQSRRSASPDWARALLQYLNAFCRGQVPFDRTLTRCSGSSKSTYSSKRQSLEWFRATLYVHLFPLTCVCSSCAMQQRTTARWFARLQEEYSNVESTGK